MRRTLVLSLAALALTGGVVAGCGSGSSSAPPSGSTTSSTKPAPAESNPAGDIPDNQAYVAYQPARGGFTVKVPEGWARTATGSTVTFTDKLNRIEIASGNAKAAPTPQSVKSAVVPVLQRQVPKFQMGKVTVVSRPAGQAVLLTYQGDSAPDAVTGKAVHDAFERYSFFRGGRQVDLTLSGPVGADNVDPWRIVTDSFRWQ
ncbi:hypothetical protein ACNPQM_38355 [Streptomyces sp. NPDC056231]|uniref:hypothetical protein n=1 Tax=Streptomyces sp. NPDC056231 TaxID=3345755 RepID=UPI003AB026F8